MTNKTTLANIDGIITTEKVKGRFQEIISTQKIIDTKTGKQYDGIIDTELLKLINKIITKEPITLQSYASKEDIQQIETTLKRYSIGKDGLIRDYNRQIDNDEILQRLNKCENEKIKQKKQIQQLQKEQKLILKTLYLRGYKGITEIESIIKK